MFRPLSRLHHGQGFIDARQALSGKCCSVTVASGHGHDAEYHYGESDVTAKLVQLHGNAARAGRERQHLAEEGVDHVDTQAHNTRQVYLLVLGNLGRQVMLEVVPMKQRRVQVRLGKQTQHTHLPTIPQLLRMHQLEDTRAKPCSCHMCLQLILVVKLQ